MIIRRVAVLSLGKVLGALHALLGLIFGAITAFLWVLIVLLGITTHGENAEGAGALIRAD